MKIYGCRQSPLCLLRKQPALDISEGIVWNDPSTPGQQGMEIHRETLLKQQDTAAKFVNAHETAAFVNQGSSVAKVAAQ